MFKSFISFTLGCVSGYFIARLVLDKKYDARYDKEIENIKLNYYGEKYIKKESVNNEKNKYISSNIIKKYDTASDNMEVKKEDDFLTDKPYNITEAEFGEFEDYETSTLTLFSDNVMLDSADNFMDKMERVKIVGDIDYEDFGDNNVIFVRNDALKSDYEILRDFSEYYN